MSNDPDRELLLRLMSTWFDLFGKSAMMVRDVVRILDDQAVDTDELQDVLECIAGERVGINRRKLGWWLKSHASRIVDGKRLEKVKGNGSAERWAVFPAI